MNIKDLVLECPMFIVTQSGIDGQQWLCNEYTLRNIMLHRALGNLTCDYTVIGVGGEPDEYKPANIREDGILDADVYGLDLAVNLTFDLLKAKNKKQ